MTDKEEDFKRCTKCRKWKRLDQFYMNGPKRRSECKPCTIARNSKYQRRVEAWRYRDVNVEARKLYMRDYYQKHKDKFAGYREKFRNKNPGYQTQYKRDKRDGIK